MELVFGQELDLPEATLLIAPDRSAVRDNGVDDNAKCPQNAKDVIQEGRERQRADTLALELWLANEQVHAVHALHVFDGVRFAVAHPIELHEADGLALMHEHAWHSRVLASNPRPVLLARPV